MTPIQRMAGHFFLWRRLSVIAPHRINHIALRQTLSWGNVIYPVRGNLIYSLHHAKARPPLHGDCLRNVPKSIVFARDKDSSENKNKTLHRVMQGLIFLWRGLNVFALARLNHIAPRHSILDLAFLL